MPYSDLIKQETEYTYSANIQFDIENDRKLLRFIPNETTTELLKEYFSDITRQNPEHHARILYGSYGTGKSHFLTVLSLLLGKNYTDGFAFNTFNNRLSRFDPRLAADITFFVQDSERKPFLIVPIVFDFEDFDRCIYFSLRKVLDSLGIQVQFKTFYDQASQLKLNIHIVFCHTALEVIDLIHHVENIICNQILLGAEQAQIGYIDLESINVTIVFKGLFCLLHFVDLGYDTRQAKPLNGIFKL